MHFTNSILAVGLIASSVVAHPGPHPVAGRSEIQKRNVMAKRCAGAAAAMNQKRYEKRNFAKRAIEARANVTYQITTEAPYYEVIQNDTCVLTPEVTQGPYVWPRSQTLRQDMSEGESGIPFVCACPPFSLVTF